MKKVRIFAAVMAVVMTVGLFAGCKRNTTPWQEEAKALVAEKMDDSNVGQFVIDGVKYEFPMQVKDFVDNGWNFEVESTGTTIVQPYAWNPSYINLRNADNKSIEIGVYNNTDAATTILESTVGEVRISNLQGKTMISGGIDFYGTTFEANGNLGEHAAAGFELTLDTVAGNGNVFTKEFQGSNGKNCTATFYFGDYKENIVLKEVKYECSFEIPYTDAATGMILAVTNNDPAALSALDSTIEADEFVKEVRSYLAEDLVFALGFDCENLTDEQYEKAYKILDGIYAQTQFSVQDKGYNTLITFNAPTNIDEVISAAFEAASEEYEGDSDEAMSDPEYLNLVLDNFDTSALEFMPGRDYLVVNNNFIEGIYATLYYMIGFAE